ncbi:MAG: hypothetical protein ACAH88_09205 [Roseimicrobium sp.]
MAYLNSRPRTPEVCPVCGEDVPPKSLACPECGADHNSGWKKDAHVTDGLDLPDDDDDFNYDEFVKREFGGGSPSGSTGLKPVWWVTAVVLLVALVVGMLFSIF